MTKNGIMLSVVAVILAVIYAVFFTDWFRSVTIPIIAQTRPGRAMNLSRTPDQPAVSPVTFMFDKAYKLSSVKVFAADNLATNKSPVALWHLISDSASVPTKAMYYGLPIKGMKPAKPHTRAQTLLPGVNYVIQVQAGKISGQTNFHTSEAVLFGGR